MSVPAEPAAPHGSGASPLVVTLRLDADATLRFTALRRAHFPAHRNWIDAHVTLFHALPGSSLDRVLADAGEIALATAPFEMQVDRIVFLGRGVAYAFASSRATDLRSALAERWLDLLGRQDRSWSGPLHVTVQNKVSPAEARSLHDALARDFVAAAVRATGLQVWHYEGGPWREAASFDFG